MDCEVDHSESYNPPEEYLPSESEKREWEESSPEDRSGRFTALTRRKRNFLPQKFARENLVDIGEEPQVAPEAYAI